MRAHFNKLEIRLQPRIIIGFIHHPIYNALLCQYWINHRRSGIEFPRRLYGRILLTKQIELNFKLRLDTCPIPFYVTNLNQAHTYSDLHVTHTMRTPHLVLVTTSCLNSCVYVWGDFCLWCMHFLSSGGHISGIVECHANMDDYGRFTIIHFLMLLHHRL